MDDLYEVAKKKMAIFLPETAKRQQAFEERGGLFAHYTSANNVVNILRSKQLWMRNVQVMNDFSEIRHGIHQVSRFLESQHAEPLKNAISRCQPDAWEHATKRYEDWKNHLSHHTFLFCLSEHAESENDLGRLSMWRAYGGNSAKAAILIKFPFGHIDTGIAYEINFSPALYFSELEILAHFKTIAESIDNNFSYVSSLGLDEITRMTFVILFTTSISLKHPGFREELEWRLMHVPGFFSPTIVKTDGLPLMRQSIELIESLPQSVYKIKLENDDEHKITGINITQIIEKIIIGPTEHPLVLYNALIAELKNVGFSNAEKIVTASQIPLRT